MKKKNLALWSVLGVIVIVAVVFLMNREFLIDNFRGMSYSPSEGMSRIMDELELTDRGKFLFKASQPILSGRGEFNAHCRTDLSKELAVLGCYVDGDIYVYDIDSEELTGIRELTTAHELLHAVWARMGEGERKSLAEKLTQVLNGNQDILAEEIDGYGESEKQEELYVRAGTEVKNLPTELEKHYAEIFRDQDKVVGYYDRYITVFRQLEAEMDEMMTQMNGLKAQIDDKTTEYETRSEQLKKDIISFNECAETEGCFNSQWAFNAKREELTAERNALEALYTEVNGLVEQHNALVEKYNADVIYNEKLNSMINSSKEPAEIE